MLDGLTVMTSDLVNASLVVAAASVGRNVTPDVSGDWMHECIAKMPGSGRI